MTETKQRNRIMCHSSGLTMAALAMVILSVVLMPVSSRVSAFATTLKYSSTSSHDLKRSRMSQLRSMSLEQVSDFYQNFPLQSAVLTCGFKASVADTIAQVRPQMEENNTKLKQKQQSISPKASNASPTTPVPLGSKLRHQEDQQQMQPFSSSNNNSIDWEARRNLAYVLYGGIFVGAMSHVEYSCVFPYLFGNEKSLAIIIQEVFFDNLIMAPMVWLPPAYFIKACVYGSSSSKGVLEEGLEKYLADVRDNHLLWKYWAIWFPAQSISFSVIPDHLRVAFMASISFFWFILFSTVSSQGDKNINVKET